MKSPLWRALALISLSILIPTLMLEDAQAARRSGLAGNLQITDPDDVNIFPHHNLRYRDRMTIDMGGENGNYSPPAGGPVDASGSATLIFGSEQWALNLSASRGDFLNGLASGFWGGNDRGLFSPLVSVHGSGPTNLDPFQFNWVDAGFAWALDSSELGVRVGVGRVADKTVSTPTGGAVTTNDEFAHVFHVQASWGNEKTDIGAEIGMGKSGLKGPRASADPDPDLSGDYTQWTLALRHYHEMGGYEWCVLGAFNHGSDKEDLDTDPVAQFKESTNSWIVGFGPIWRNAPETWQVAAQLNVGNQALKEEPPTPNSQTDIRYFTVPGFTGSMEYIHGRWAVRGGVRSVYNFHRSDAQGNPEVEIFDRTYDFSWVAGASVAIGDNFLLDAALNEQRVLQGANFLGGGDQAAFAMLSATVNWGGGKK
jgi:hypothetical protein